MTHATADSVRAFFDAEIARGRRLLPDPSTTGGLGTFRKYERAAALMTDASVHDVLDVGCNRGSVEALFHATSPEKAARTLVRGVDVSEQAIARARELGLPNCTFQSYEGRVLPCADASVDLVVMIEVLEHVIEKEALLREIHRVLRPGGRLYLTTPNPECLALRIESGAWGAMRVIARRPPPAKDAFITQGALAALLDRIGFAHGARSMFTWPHAFVHVSEWGVVPPLPPSLLFRFQRFCLRHLERDDLPPWVDRRLKWTIVAEVTRR